MTDLRNPVENVPCLVGQLYELVAHLEGLFMGRRFTPDGHLVGNSGEVIAAYRYGLSYCLTLHKGMMLALSLARSLRSRLRKTPLLRSVNSPVP